MFVKKIYERMKNTLKKWRAKTPKQKWQAIYNIGATLAEAIGATVYTTMENYWFSYLTEVFCTIYIVTVVYTVWYYFERQEYLRGLQSTAGVGVLFSNLIMKIQTLTQAKYKINYMINFGGRYVYMDRDKSPKLLMVREKMIDDLIRNVVVTFALIVIAFGMFGMTSSYLIVFRGVRMTFMGIELPFVDKDSDFGFWLNITLQSMFSAMSIVACSVIEISVILINNVFSAIPHLIRVDLEEVNKEWNLNGMTLVAKSRLRNVFIKIQDYGKFIRDSIEVYYARAFIGPFLFTYSISFSIFGQMLLGYQSGYGFAVGNYLFLLIMCHVGEKIEQSKKGIAEELYNSQWYLLPTKSQKQLRSAMHMIQNGGTLTIGPFSKLNMESATNLTKLIFRITMTLYRILI